MRSYSIDIEKIVKVFFWKYDETVSNIWQMCLELGSNPSDWIEDCCNDNWLGDDTFQLVMDSLPWNEDSRNIYDDYVDLEYDTLPNCILSKGAISSIIYDEYNINHEWYRLLDYDVYIKDIESIKRRINYIVDYIKPEKTFEYWIDPEILNQYIKTHKLSSDIKEWSPDEMTEALLHFEYITKA